MGVDLASAALALGIIEPMRIICKGYLPEVYHSFAWCAGIPLFAFAMMLLASRISGDVFRRDNYHFTDRFAASFSFVASFFMLILASAEVAIMTFSTNGHGGI